jgi:hypothetical protein
LARDLHQRNIEVQIRFDVVDAGLDLFQIVHCTANW